jgi:hypothetical protein
MTPERERQRLNQLRYAETVCRVLCRRSGLVEGWRWQAKGRRPPLPFWERKPIAGSCRICGQPIYGGGSFRKFAGPQSKRITWHNACTTAYFLWIKPSDYAGAIVWRQNGLCALSGEPVGLPAREYLSDVEVDHEIPIYQIRRDRSNEPWFDLLRFLGLGNLRAITIAAHKSKSIREAAERARMKLRATPDLFERLNSASS